MIIAFRCSAQSGSGFVLATNITLSFAFIRNLTFSGVVAALLLHSFWWIIFCIPTCIFWKFMLVHALSISIYLIWTLEPDLWCHIRKESRRMFINDRASSINNCIKQQSTYSAYTRNYFAFATYEWMYGRVNVPPSPRGWSNPLQLFSIGMWNALLDTLFVRFVTVTNWKLTKYSSHNHHLFLTWVWHFIISSTISERILHILRDEFGIRPLPLGILTVHDLALLRLSRAPVLMYIAPWLLGRGGEDLLARCLTGLLT